MRFEVHSHTDYSNIRLLDCINRLPNLIKRAQQIGLSGIAITDHESLGSHVQANKLAKDLVPTGFKIALGNEIYLVDERESGQKYYHLILIAKDEYGYEQIKRLSSNAWYYSYQDYGLRVPTLKRELQAIVRKNPGHLIATTACLGGELSTLTLNLCNAEAVNDSINASVFHHQIVEFMQFMIDLFGDDFYIECAPGTSEEQIIVNNRLSSISEAFKVKMVIGTDAHYLTKNDRPIHKAYLTSKDGDRETDAFYKYSYLQDEDDIKKYLSKSCLGEKYDILVNNSEEIYEKITFFDLHKEQDIPLAPVQIYPKKENKIKDCPIFSSMFESDDEQKRAWANEIYNKLEARGFMSDEYLHQIETEADVIEHVSKELNLSTTLFAYFNTFKHYIDLFWKCGSSVGPGRGSATGFLSNYLLDITQLDPVKWNLPWWRFLNKERVELPDIDIDLAPSKRQAIFEAIRQERGELNLLQVCTYGTEAPKSAILTACRGYRSDDYPEGIEVEDAQFLSSLIPQERGFLWSIEDVVYGNEEKGRKPVTTFIKEVNKYPGLLEIIENICGLINKRGCHASGVILYNNEPFKTGAFMRTPDGTLVTQYDLHDAEYAGDIKYDFLATEVTDKIISCLNLMQEYNVIEKGQIRTLYNKYLHPSVLNISDTKIWEALWSGSVIDVFQFNSGVGLAIAKKLKPDNPIDLTAANAMMRLMSEKGQESMQDRYYRIKMGGIDEFEIEMKNYGLTAAEREIMHKHCDETYGCVPMQEQMMIMLMDIAGFTLKEANNARKIVAKKKMEQIPVLKEQVMSKFEDKNFGQYFWDIAIRPSLGYAFSKNHSLPYSFVGIQTLVLATQFNPIFWNTACLIVNSGSLEDNSTEELVDLYEPESQELAEGTTFVDLPDRSGKIKKTSSTDYTKIAKAIGAITNAGIRMSLIDINKSQYGFTPDVENNTIMFGLKALNSVGEDVSRDIIANRPYDSMWDFLSKVKVNKTAMVSLIKSGAFDKFYNRKAAMAYYLYYMADTKKNLTLSNFPTLIKNDLLPSELDESRKLFEFNRYLKAECKNVEKDIYVFTDRAFNYYQERYDINILHWNENGQWEIGIKQWDNIYQKGMDEAREYLKANKEEMLTKLNINIFMQEWNKSAEGSISHWEMQALCFYYHEHELSKLNKIKYGIENWNDLLEEPDIDYEIERRGHIIPIYNIHTIAGTCIAKDKARSTVTLLTPDGIANVKFRKDYFSLFDKQISKKQPDGTKKVVDKSWFSRGSMIMVKGIRRGDDFIVKKYKNTSGHQLYKISSIDENGEIIITSEREE